MTNDELKALALAGIRGEITRLQNLLTELEGAVPNPSDVPPKRGRRPLTDAEKRKISRRMRKMWTERRAAKKV
jgi:hypothetical protein